MLTLGLTFFPDAHESDSDKDDNGAENLGQEMPGTHQETETDLMSTTERTVQSPQEAMDPISVTADGAGGCQTLDSEEEPLCKSHSGFTLSCVYSPDLNRRVLDPSCLFYPAQVNSWYSCATMDRAVPCGLNLAAPARTLFPMCRQQHALVQVRPKLGCFNL